MSRLSGHRAALLVAACLCLVGLESQAAEPETTRTYLQATLGYYSPADGWKVYSECRSRMDQPLQHTEYGFKRLTIPQIDTLAREAKTVSDLYQRYTTAADAVSLTKFSKNAFWNLGKDQGGVTEAMEDTAAKWPTYRDNMARFKRASKSAHEFLQLTASERAALFADSQGTGRSLNETLRGYYSAQDGWTTYQDCRQKMGLSVDYTEYQFTHLTIKELDSLARAAKSTYDLYQRYGIAFARLGLESMSADDFCRLGERQLPLVERAEDTASKWPEYSDNMKRLGEPFKDRREFFDLSAEERAKKYQSSRGSGRSATDFVSGSYSAASGWKAYRDALSGLGIRLKYSEFQFINLDIKTVDRLARHATNSHSLYSKLKDLGQLAGKPCPCRATDIYDSEDLSKWDQEYLNRQKEWAARILYADSCRRVGAGPNWSAFESRTTNEQLEAAALADSLANNLLEYTALCDKLEHPKDAGFLDLPVANQRETINALGDELWMQRKEMIKTGAKVAAVIVAAIIVKKGYDQIQGTVAHPPPAETPTGPQGSRIDRNAFAKQRRIFWKSEAQDNPGKYLDNPENLNRMKEGKPPIGNDGFPMQLHHPDGNPAAKLVPMTKTDHVLGPNFAKNHPWLLENKP